MALERLRNIGVVAHIDAGKTTVSERILFYAGIERRMGEVHEGTAVMDWMGEERKRGITITAASTCVPWRDHSINLIDTPGHVDFTVEVERCMRVLDGAILVLNGVAGVQAQSETVARQMGQHGVRAIAFVNQLDRAGADYLRAVGELRSRLSLPAIPVQFPLGSGRDLRAIVDLVRREAFEYREEDLGREPVPIPVPEEVADEVDVLRAELVEALAEEDEGLLAAFLEEREPDPAALTAALRARVRAGTLVPVLCGAALRNVGIQPLLDAVVDYLPAPPDVPPTRASAVEDGSTVELEPKADGPRCAFAFKLVADPNEDLLFVRVYSGTIRPGEKLFNPRTRRMERVARVLRMHADSRQPLEEAGPGEIVALTGCKASVTGDTLCEHDGAVLLERLHFPDPVVTRVVEPRATADRDRLRQALERLAYEDPSFRVQEDAETGQWRIAGMGELHLEIKEHRLADDFHLEVSVGQPRVAYREAPTVTARGAAVVDRQLGGSRIHGAVALELVPVETGADQAADREGEAGERPERPERPGARIDWAGDCQVPEPFRAAVTDALAMGLEVGPRFGFPLTGVRLRVEGGASEPERDAEAGFVQAAGQALREAFAEARVALLEPVMAFEIEAPSEFMSGIIGELNAKRARIEDLSAEEGTRTVRGLVPLFDMFGYASTLRSLSQGRAQFSLHPAGFQAVPEDVLESRGLTWS